MYESGYSLRMFQILEDDVVDFLTYIPLEYYLGDKRKEIFSPRLAELLIRIGSQVDIFFKNWDIVHEVYKNKYPNKKFNQDKLDIGNYKDIERDGKKILSNKEIRILSTDELLTPFKCWTDNGYPLWWKAYNNVKHQGFKNKIDGNLFNVIESLSALFLINCINKETTLKLIEYGYYDFNPDEINKLKRQIREYKELGSSYIPSSPRGSQLFEYKEPPSSRSLYDF